MDRAPPRLVGLAVLFAVACIIPDAFLEVQPERTNPNAVRIVQEVGLTDEVNAACREVDADFVESCPIPPRTQTPGLVDLSAEGQTFCVCPAGERDANALREFDILVEDGDTHPNTGAPVDSLFGVFLLDPLPGEPDPSVFQAYTNYLAANDPAQLHPIGPASYRDAIDRPPPNLKSWRVAPESSVDLCNDNNGAKLEPGLHQLRLVVTDRPWYVPVVMEDGKPKYDGGELVRTGEEGRPGVPDLPTGASFDSATFVFRCLDESTSDSCNCVSEEDDT